METDHEYVVRKLRARDISLQRISGETGLTVAWMSSVARRLTGDPGFKKINTLAKYFRLLERQESERAALMSGGNPPSEREATA